LNQLRISGLISSCSPIRYTPAGLPVLEIKLDHNEAVIQAGVSRDVQCEVSVVVVGDLAQMWKTSALGEEVEVVGFISPARKKSPRFVLNATEIYRCHKKFE
jgi:primosomal replication protein N